MLCFPWLPHAVAHERLSPHQRVILDTKSPAPVDAAFSFYAPPGPTFTDAEKEAQLDRGKLVMPMIRKAFADGEGEVKIPPGDYRFGQERYEGARVIYPLGFENMQRDAEHPFVVDATGATFWFDLDDKQMPPGHRCVGFQNCRNIVLRGAILDRGTRGCIEGRITRIVLRASSSVEVSATAIMNSANDILLDQENGGPMLGLDDCQKISLDGKKIESAPKRIKVRK